jgi:thioredoxin reductase
MSTVLIIGGNAAGVSSAIEAGKNHLLYRQTL